MSTSSSPRKRRTRLDPTRNTSGDVAAENERLRAARESFIAGVFPDDLPPLVSPAVLAEFLCVHPETIRRWARTGRLASIKLSPGRSGRVLVPVTEFRRLLDERLAAGRANSE